MKILELCLRVPFPPNDGGAFAMNSLISGLKQNGCSLTVLALNTPKHFVEVDKIPSQFLNGVEFKAMNIDTSVSFWGAVKSILTPRDSYNISRFYSNAFSNEIVRTLDKNHFDLVIFESLFMSPYLPIIKKYSRAKTLLRSHNIEFSIWQNLAKTEKNPFKKWYLSHLAKRLEKYEKEITPNFDAISCISEKDLLIYQQWGIKKPLTVTSIGVDMTSNHYQVNLPKYPETIYQIASMDWLPNVEGVEWFLNQVWPILSKRAPSLVCKFAGRKMPKKYLSLKIKNVEFYGFIENVPNFQVDNNVLIVPLLTGSGIRVKIIEALAMGKVIVSTPKGAEGLNLTDRVNILIASTPEEFAQKVYEAVYDTQLAQTISRNAREFAARNLSNSTIAGNLIKFVQGL